MTGGVDAVALTHLDTARRHVGELRICRGYEIDGQLVTTIAPGPPRELAGQEVLANALLRARPRYDTAGRSTADEWAEAVAGILSAPVVIRSRGPAVADKTWHPRAAVSR